MRPLISEIKRDSRDDGPGIRSVVFFKGCPLRCVFCHNPETQTPAAEVAFSASHCLGCGACARACPQGAISLASSVRLDRSRCLRCGACARACPGRGLRLIGRFFAPDELADLLLRDLPFYHHSGGGVTLSGGECTQYPEYLGSLLPRLKAHGVHVALQTSGAFTYEGFARAVLPYLDLVYFDLKLADEAQHRHFLGLTNTGIHRNLRRLLAEGSVEVHPRIPLVPGVTATPENLAGLAHLLHEVGARQVSLLPYHPLGLPMYEQLGRPRPDLPDHFLSPAEEEAWRGVFAGLLAAEHAPDRPLPRREVWQGSAS